MTQSRPDLLRGPRPYLLAALSGALYFLGFPGFDLWPLALVALTPLYAILQAGQLTGRRALGLGVTFGFVTHCGGYYWLVGMLERFSGFPLAACVFFVAAICLYQGGQLALFFWLWARLTARGWSPTWCAMPVYCACELAYPMLFSSYFGNNLHQFPLMLQVSDIGGPILISALVVGANSALYALLRTVVGKKRLPKALLATVAAAWCMAALYGSARIAEVQGRAAAAPQVKVGVVQTNMGIFAKRYDPVEGHRRHLEQSLQLERDVAPDLLVWPESAVAASLPADVRDVRDRVTGPLSTPVLFGGVAVAKGENRRRYHNTAFITDSRGRVLSTYDKTYLLAFGEYLPFGDMFPILYRWSPNSGRFTPGNHLRPMRFRTYRISTLICYEDILPAFVRKAVKKADPHLLVNITNDSWFGDTNEPWIHLALAKFRAAEHHRYLVRATNSGVSAIIDPVGRVVTHSGVFERRNLHAKVAMMRGVTLYQVLGDWAGWAGLLWTVWAGFFWSRRRAEASQS